MRGGEGDEEDEIERGGEEWRVEARADVHQHDTDSPESPLAIISLSVW